MKSTKYISFFALLCCALIFSRVAAVHVYTHDDGNDVENCIVCDVLLDTQNNNVQAPDQMVLAPRQVVVAHFKAITSWTFVARTLALPSNILSRPPPAIA